MTDETDEYNYLESVVDGLLDGEGASEDHEAFLTALAGAGIRRSLAQQIIWNMVPEECRQRSSAADKARMARPSQITKEPE